MRKNRKNSLRLQGYDYGSDGAYFLTICVKNRRCCLSEIHNECVHLTAAGEVVKREWLRSAELRDEIFLGDYVIMPNHMHMVVFQVRYDPPLLHPITGLPQTPGYQSKPGPSKQNISSLMRGFKSVATSAIRKGGIPDFTWQVKFNDRIIRSEAELARVNRYIANNPRNWPDDLENPG